MFLIYAGINAKLNSSTVYHLIKEEIKTSLVIHNSLYSEKSLEYLSLKQHCTLAQHYKRENIPTLQNRYYSSILPIEA